MKINKELLKFVGSNKRKDLHRKFSSYAGSRMEFDIEKLHMAKNIWSQIIIYRKRTDSGCFCSYLVSDSQSFLIQDDFVFRNWKLLF